MSFLPCISYANANEIPNVKCYLGIFCFLCEEGNICTHYSYKFPSLLFIQNEFILFASFYKSQQSLEFVLRLPSMSEKIVSNCDLLTQRLMTYLKYLT